ncbi:hypothetical protein DU002_12505 [Corallincola holothuriorum]|uniref:Uncharacterized protein n=1 Tax=Corallincola holothuriorum TaxID=2282215 RepID=A0A368NGD6_9GAMM|nr:hypothetical protein [Corallincola holothuriorum]RCU49170.1 hypothetical protein DU002_12505 [Corallincola holothuriorum]
MANLSDVFKYISHFRHAGHQVGRKVGDMLEVLTYAAIARDNNMLARLHVEPKLHGHSDAGHKVEFILLENESFDDDGNPNVINGGAITNPSEVISFIECKKVGVEQTINGPFKKKFKKNGSNKNYLMPYNEDYVISFAPRGQEKHTYTVKFSKDNKINITRLERPDFLFSEEIGEDHRIIFALSDDYESTVISNNSSLRMYEPTLHKCKILEIYGSTDDNVIALLNDCLSGPQTPEKAKQSSFVALDVRKKRFDSCDKRGGESEMPSVLVMTEFAHWEEKSQNMIRAYIDMNFVVGDSIIVEAFELFEERFGADFYNKITKENFEKSTEVRELAIEVVNRHDGLIFRDIEDGELKKFAIQNDKFIATS